MVLVESITGVMKDAKTLKNTAELSSFTHLKPIINNETRWSGIRLMLDRFIEIRTELIATADLEGSTIGINRSVQFLRKCKKYQVYMEQIDSVTKYLQTRCQSFETARLELDTMMKQVEEDAETEGKLFYKCTFEQRRIQMNNADRQFFPLHPIKYS